MSKKFIYIDASGFSVEANSYESTDYINSTAGAADAAKHPAL